MKDYVKTFFPLQLSYYCNSLKFLITSNDSCILLSPCSFNDSWSCLSYCFFILKLASYPLDLLIGVLPLRFLELPFLASWLCVLSTCFFTLTLCLFIFQFISSLSFLFSSAALSSFYFVCVDEKCPHDMSPLILFSISSVYFIKFFSHLLTYILTQCQGLFQDF